MNPTLNNNSVVFTSPTNKGYSLSDFNDYDYNFQTAEKKFGEPNQIEFSSPVVQIDSISKIHLQTQMMKKPDIQSEVNLQKNYSSQDLRLNSHQAREKQQLERGERLLSENSSFVRKSLNNSVNVNQLSPKLSPMKNSLMSMKSSTVSETSGQNQKFGQHHYFSSTNNIGVVPIQVIPSQVTHVYLSETSNGNALSSSNKIIFKESKLRNSTTNLSSINQSPINKEYSSKNFNTVTTTASISDNNKGIKGTECSIVSNNLTLGQQVTSIKQQVQQYNNTTNYANSSFNSIQQQFGDFLTQEDHKSGNQLSTNNYHYTQESDNSLNKHNYAALLADNPPANTFNHSDAKSFLEIQQKMLFLISENEKLIEYNESLMKENKIIKQGKDAQSITHRQEVNDWKQKYNTTVENRDKEIRQLRDQVMRLEVENEEIHRESLKNEKQFFEREEGYLRKITEHAQEMAFNNNSISQVTTQHIHNKVIEEANVIASDQLLKRQESRIKDLEGHIVKLQSENSKLVQTLSQHDSTAREQLTAAHSQSLEKIERLLQNANTDKKQLEEQLRRELQNIQSEKNMLQYELSSQKSESLQMSRMVTDDISKLESDKFTALNRVNEIELKCERLILDVQQLNTLLAERLQQINSIESINKDLEQSNKTLTTQIESIETEKLYLSEESKVLKIQLREMEDRHAELIEHKYEQEQLVEKYQKMTEQSQKMNTEYLSINETHLQKIQELEEALSSSNVLLEKLDQKDHYISQLIQTIESDKEQYQNENQQLIEEIKRLDNNHIYEIEQLKNQDLNHLKLQEQEQLLIQAQLEKESMRQEFEQLKFQFEKDAGDLHAQLEEEKQHNLEQIQSLKVEVSSKKDNFLKLQELEQMNDQLIEQLDIKEKAFQQTCLNYEERINQEVHSHSYQVNMQLTNLKSAMRQLEEDNNTMKLDLDAHKRELDRQRIRYQDLVNEKDQVVNQFERQIHSIAQQSERTIHNLKQEKEREMTFLQREHQRMQLLLQEKADVISRLQSYSSQQSQYPQNASTMNINMQQERYSSKHLSSGLQSSTSQQNLLKKHSSLSNISSSAYEGLSEQDENSNITNTIKRQPAHYMPPLPHNTGVNSMYSKNSQQQQQQIQQQQSHLSMQRHSSVQSMGMQSIDAQRYDTTIVEENDMLNKMILERCKNIVEGKIAVPDNSGPYASSKYTSSANEMGTGKSIQQQGQYQSLNPMLYNQNSDRV